MQNPNDFAVAAHWSGTFDESGVRAWAENLRRDLKSETVSLGLVFMTPQFFPMATQILQELLQSTHKFPFSLAVPVKA